MPIFANSFGQAWPLSKLLFSWLDPIVFKARFNKLKLDDLKLAKSEQAEAASNKFLDAWNEQLKKPNPNLLLALAKCFIVDFLLAGNLA
jgi:hypothetical protein